MSLDLSSGARSVVPLAQAADGSWTPDGRTLFFTRLPFQGSHTKRYRGGTAQSVWKHVEGVGGGRAPHRRLRRDEQDADVVEAGASTS